VAFFLGLQVHYPIRVVLDSFWEKLKEIRMKQEEILEIPRNMQENLKETPGNKEEERLRTRSRAPLQGFNWIKFIESKTRNRVLQGF